MTSGCGAQIRAASWNEAEAGLEADHSAIEVGDPVIGALPLADRLADELVAAPWMGRPLAGFSAPLPDRSPDERVTGREAAASPAAGRQ